MDNSIRFVSAAFACCEKWLFSCMLLIVFFPPLERVLPTLPNPFPGQYMLYVKVALAGSFSIILINAKSKGWAKQCRTTRAFPSLLCAICSLLLTFLILPFPPPISGNQSAKKQQPLTQVWLMTPCPHPGLDSLQWGSVCLWTYSLRIFQSYAFFPHIPWFGSKA